MSTITKRNGRAFSLLGRYLNYIPDYVTGDKIKSIADGVYVKETEAYTIILAAACGLDTESSKTDRELYETYFRPTVIKDQPELYRNDPYYRNVKLPTVRDGNFELNKRCLAAYELFVRDDPVKLPDGTVLPQLGYFDQPFTYPAVFENGRLWMSLLPNEINTTLPAVEKAKGKVLTYGLGLGYFCYRAALKAEVSEVVAIERSPEVIELFKDSILPAFGSVGDKIRVIEADALDYAYKVAPTEGYDYVFADIWHDPTDGIELYRKLKGAEPLYGSNTAFDYWVEKTLRLYMGDDIEV